MKTLIITNIASPYRVDFFDYLQRNYPSYGFCVLYTSEKQEGREWDTENGKIRSSYFLQSKELKIGRKGWERTIYFPENPEKTLDEISPDVVVASEYNPTALSALSWCKKRHIPFVHWTDGTLVNERNLNPVQKWSRKKIVSGADSFIASSSKAKEKLEVYGAKRKIFISSLTVDIEKYLTKKTESGTKTLITVGGLIERKGIDLLLDSLGIAPQKYDLWVVGNGPEKEALEKKAKDLGINTTFFGFLQGEALKQKYAEADAFVFPSREDCFGLTPLEAMCASLPIVCSTYADGGYDLIDGNGEMADPFDKQAFFDAIERVVEANGTDNNLGKLSYERAFAFAFEKVAPPFVEAVDEARKKRVLLIDNVSDGHHQVYAKTIYASNEVVPSIVFPNGIDGAIQIPQANISGFHPLSYLKWMRKLKKIAKEVRPHIVHFLDGNPLVNYQGVGMGWCKKYETIVTYHLHFRNKLKDRGHKKLSRFTSVVHTKKLKEDFQKLYGGRVEHIEYPDFLLSDTKRKERGEEISLLALGQTRREKGLDLLLEALQNVKGKYKLVVAGAPDYFDEEFIKRNASCPVELKLHFLTEEELKETLFESDVIVLPYRGTFEGASGPLTEGVGYQKCIVGPNRGSLGEIITKNHVGYTFESENVTSLAQAIERAIETDFSYDEKALAYRNYLMPERFRKEYVNLYLSL